MQTLILGFSIDGKREESRSSSSINYLTLKQSREFLKSSRKLGALRGLVGFKNSKSPK